MKKSIAWLLMIITQILLCVSLGKTQNVINKEVLSADEQAWIKEHPVVRATNYAEWPPIDFFVRGQAAGLSVDYLNLVAGKIGLNIEYVTGDDWTELVKKAQNHEIDILQSAVNLGDRDQYWDFSPPYFNFLMTFFGPVGAEPILTVDNLIGKKIGAIKDWSSYIILKEYYPHLNIIEQPSVKAALTAVSAGQIDVFVDRLPTSNFIISRNFITGVEVIGQSVLPESSDTNPIRFGVRKDWPMLSILLNKGMSLITDDEFHQLLVKWNVDYVLDNVTDLSPEEYKWLSLNKKILVASDPSMSPVSQISSEGKLDGVAGAYLNAIGKKLNIEFEWVGNETWIEGLNKVSNGEAHIMTSVTPTPDSREHLNFTDSYMVVTNMIFNRSNGPSYGNLRGLIGKKIALVKSYSVTHKINQDYPDIEIIEVDNTEKALELLAEGDVDAFISGIPTTANKIAAIGYGEIVISGETPYKSESTFGIRKDLPLLASAMNKALNSITPVETAEISRKWMALKIESSNSSLILQIAIFSSSIIGIILIWTFSLRREVNQRKLIENELRKSQREAETASAAKSTFLANMSHEIRTPLNAIIGFSEVISSEMFGKINQIKYKEYLKDIRRSGQHLAVVINDILDLSKIEAGKWQLKKTEFEILRLLETEIRMLKENAKEKNIALTIKIEPKDERLALLADEICFKRIIGNLLSNAIKFTEIGGQIICNIFRTDENGVVIEVIDNGVGIPKDRLEHVLSPFGQQHDVQKVNEAGTGLGLTIVDQLVRLHSGEFSLESKVGVGTCATLKLNEASVIL